MPRLLCIAWLGLSLLAQPLVAADLKSETVLDALRQAQQFLKSQQHGDGSFETGGKEHQVGISCIAILALVNSGLTIEDPAVKRGVQFIRQLRPDEPTLTYEVSLAMMALSAAKAPNNVDLPRIKNWADRLERSQNRQGDSAGGWSYNVDGNPSGAHDPSNTQFAVLGLREAAEVGVPVSRDCWVRAQDYWVRSQNADGGWGYGRGTSSGSMTVAGIATLSITDQMLLSERNVSPDGVPDCCRNNAPPKELERALRWMSRHFEVGQNPGNHSNWLLYYIYGMERAGRLSGQRYFGDHDWYREGAAYLLDQRNQRSGYWLGAGGGHEDSKVLATSFALLFLSKGLAPVLINKLKYGPHDRDRPLEIIGDDWNVHRRDVRQLTEHISHLPRWPQLLIAQEVDLVRAVDHGGVNALLQAPVVYMTGRQRPQMTAKEIELLKEYIQQGGFLLATSACQSADFDQGFRALITQLFPPGEGELKPLAPDHPVFRAEHPISPESVRIEGVEFGCRTAVMYIPEDLGCYWEYSTRFAPKGRHPQLQVGVVRAERIGVNIIAYATGREPPNKLDSPNAVIKDAPPDQIERGLLQVAKIRHSGAWDAAPRALKNLLTALNQTAGLAASTKVRDLPLTDPNVFQYPLIFMHGRQRFSLGPAERDQLKKYLERGGVLFADSCCGSKPFDKDFRELMTQLFPQHPLTRIPIEHELFTEETGHDLRKLKRRVLDAGDVGGSIKELEPHLEGVELDGRYAVIYSKYDISCALERQVNANCEGYIPEDAVKLATNIVLYSMLQDLRLRSPQKTDK